MALVALQKSGKLKFLISQNCDGLHRKSGYPAEHLAELHGNENLEYCRDCGKEFLRDFPCDRDNKKLTDHSTGRICPCGGVLLDSLIHFTEQLPKKAVDSGFEHSKKADLFLVLGSSLTVTPANEMPEGTQGHLVVCNLQTTPLDKQCSLRIFAKCDDLMRKVMENLKMTIPDWRLKRLLEISMAVPSPGQNHLQRLRIRGIEPDGTPASYLAAIEMFIAKTQFGWKQNYEPFETLISLNCKSVKVKLTLYFMGHYKEPPLKLETSFTLQAPGSGQENVKRFLLEYDPSTGVWGSQLTK